MPDIKPNGSVAVGEVKIPQGVKVEELWAEWSAASRLFKKRNREYYTTIASLVFLLAVILFLLKEFLLIGVIIAFGFLSYVLASVPPEMTRHQVTSKGIRTSDKLFEWENLVNFWTESKWGQEIVNVRTKTAIPGQLMMILDPAKREAIIKAIGKKLPYEKPEANWTEQASKWLQDKLPIEQG